MLHGITQMLSVGKLESVRVEFKIRPSLFTCVLMDLGNA